MKLWRLAHWLHGVGLRRPAQLIVLLLRIATGAYVPAQVTIGPGTHLAYGASGLVVNRLTRIGRDCMLSPGVLLGSGQGRSLYPGAPILEDGVRVYQNAVILGGVVVGRGAVVNANAVVLENVPAGAVVNAAKSRILPAASPASGTDVATGS